MVSYRRALSQPLYSDHVRLQESTWLYFIAVREATYIYLTFTRFVSGTYLSPNISAAYEQGQRTLVMGIG